MGCLEQFARVFLLSPANTGGLRALMLLRDRAGFDVAVKLREGAATIAEVYTFISGLYFRGKMAYAERFAAAPAGTPHALIIVPGIGLLPPDTRLNADQLRAIASVPVDEGNPAYLLPLVRDAKLLGGFAGRDCQYVLLGSVATEKYTRPLIEVFGDRLLFPADFTGRGDMSRGGLMLRCARSGTELSYVPVEGAARRGPRPPRLERWRKP